MKDRTLTFENLKRQESINEKKEILKKIHRETAIMIFQTADIEFKPVKYLKENDYDKLPKKLQKLQVE